MFNCGATNETLNPVFLATIDVVYLPPRLIDFNIRCCLAISCFAGKLCELSEIFLFAHEVDKLCIFLPLCNGVLNPSFICCFSNCCSLKEYIIS